MISISKVGLQDQITNISQNAKVSYLKESDKTQKDTVTISNPAFKGSQIVAPKQMGKAKLALITFAATLLGGITTKANAKLEVATKKTKELQKETLIANKVEKLKECKCDIGDYGPVYVRAYSDEEANAIAQFMFDEPVYNKLANYLSHKYLRKVPFTYDEVMFLGNQLKENEEIVNKFSNHHLYQNDVINLLKLHQVNPKEIEELDNDFKMLSANEIEKIVDTYKKYPEQTKKLLRIQEEIREIKADINGMQHNIKCGRDMKGPLNTAEISKLQEKIMEKTHRLIDIAPNYIKEEVKPMLKRFNSDNSTSIPCEKIPNIRIEDIVSAINFSPITDLKKFI